MKPNKRYLAIAAFFPLVAVFAYWVLSHAPHSGDPIAAQIAIVVYCLLWVLPGVIIALFYKLTRLTVDDGGMVSARLLRPTVRCAWDEMTGAELKGEGYAFPCVIRANGRKIAKIMRAFDGYDQLLDLLMERGMLRENGLMDRAKFWVALDRMKVRDDELGGSVDRVQDREFAILDAETGEEIHHLRALSTGLREGEYVKVTYLPNSHLATINYRGEQP